MFGFLNIDKPPGVTSRAVVNSVHRLLPRTVRIGHAGTLDPMATGVLVLCIDQATRLVPYVQELRKSYRAGFRLGCRSETDDSTGSIVETPDAPLPARDAIEAALAPFRGTIVQTPPQYSALRVAGKRAYDLARAGVAVDLAPRTVEVSRLELLACQGRDLEVEIDCSSGTYIRSIARDLGDALAVGGLMTRLVRTAVGPFTIESAVSLDWLARNSVREVLLPAAMCIGDHPRLVASDAQAAAIRQGVKVRMEAEIASAPDAAVVDLRGGLVAFGEYDAAGTRFHPRSVFPEAG